MINTTSITLAQELAPLIMKGYIQMDEQGAKEFELDLKIKGTRTVLTYRNYDLPNKGNTDISFREPPSMNECQQLHELIDEAMFVSSALISLITTKKYKLTIS